MSEKNFLEEKFIELNQLKTLLLTYPSDYSSNIIETMDRVCNHITAYLEECKSHIHCKRESFSEFTMEELSKYDGKNGNRALVAIYGTVYDVADITKWEEGYHFGVKAGTEASEVFTNCHGGSYEILSKLLVVGTLKE